MVWPIITVTFNAFDEDMRIVGCGHERSLSSPTVLCEAVKAMGS